MAEKISHLGTITAQKPTLFEVLAQDSLNQLLHPAFQKFSSFLYELKPETFYLLERWKDEAFLLLDYFLQRFYIKNHDASFSEYFYGLKRCALGNLPLTERNKKLSIAFLVVLPYVKRKLDELSNKWKLELADNPNRKDTVTDLKRIFCLTYSLAQVSLGIMKIVQFIGYMSEKFETQTIPLRLQRLKLVYAQNQMETSNFFVDLLSGNIKPSLLNFSMVGQAIMGGFEIFAFFMQFLKTWNEERPNHDFKALPEVPPPKMDPRAEQYRGKCPICLQKFKIPCTVPVSGYVYCFSCIFHYLIENKKCFVTQLPASHLDLIRIYDSQDDD